MNKFLSAVIRNFETKPDVVFCRFVRGETVEDLRWCDVESDAAAYLGTYRSRRLPEKALILIFLPHIRDVYGSFLGAMLGGFRPAFMPCPSPKQDARLYWSSHARLFARIRPAAVIADKATLAAMAENGLELRATATIAIEEIEPAAPDWAPPGEDDIAFLQHSSGTTGLKKGVQLTYRAIAAQLDSYKAALGQRDDDVAVSWLPLYHDMGLIACFMMPAYSAIQLVQLDPFDWLVRPSRLFEHIERWKGTHTWLPNFAFEHLATMAGRDAAKYQLGSMRAWIDCSEPCRPSSLDRFARAFASSGVGLDTLHCCYAMAETVFATTQTAPDRPAPRIWCDRSSLERGRAVVVDSPGPTTRELVACGTPIEGISVEIYDESRSPLPVDHVGEIGVSGRFLFDGYNEEPDRTRAQFDGKVYFTRDLGFIHKGQVYVLGRIDDLIIVNGRNIYAHEIEAILNDLAGLKPGRSVALPREDIRNGTQGIVIVAEILAQSPRDQAAIRSEILTRIFSVTGVMAKAVHLVDEGWLVKTTSGKVSRELNAQKIAATLFDEPDK